MSRAASICLALTLLACSSPKPPETPKEGEPSATEKPEKTRRKGGGPSVESEVGALDKDATVKAFSSLLGPIERCQDDRRKKEERLDFLAGDVAIKVRVKTDGSARYVTLTKSTLGDRAVERCILDAAKKVSWPKPQGGEGIAEHELSIPMKGDRDAVAWSPDKVAKELGAAKGQLAACKAGKAGPFSLTAYVDKDGAVIAAGGAAPVEDADGAIDCLVKTLSSVKMPSPGGFPAKVTVSVD